MVISKFEITSTTTSTTSTTSRVTHLVDDRTLNFTVMVQTWSASLVSEKCQYELV